MEKVDRLRCSQIGNRGQKKTLMIIGIISSFFINVSKGLTSLFPDSESWPKENFTDYYIISSFFINVSKGLTSLFPDRESWAKENFTDYYIISSFFI
ncbi:hypothetical protein, partial [Flavobacterium sp.]|uniref:hypothetical protein n=1 Tax=Flavobacterium sp. TaxID=239 RepID=UPI0025C0CCFA